MSAPTVGLAIIARNEGPRIDRLLATCAGAFDQVVLVDTGSTDDTIEIFEAWAQTQVTTDRPHFTWTVDRFEWCDDFAAARNHADSLLTTDWRSWADCDDELRGAGRLRELAATAPPELAGYVFDYAYAHDAHGNVSCRLKRERLVRAGASSWGGRIHEAQLLEGPATFMGPEVCEWVHRPAGEGRDPDRNLKILSRWLEEEPHNPRVLAYMGTETLARGQLDEAQGYFTRYLAEDTGWDEERAQVHRKMAQTLIAAGKLDQAEQAAHQALRTMPLWPDSYLTLAEVAYHRQEWRNAGDWAKRVLELGTPDTLLIINPLEYTMQPRVILAGAMGALGQLEAAIATAQEVLDVIPDHQEVAKTAAVWQGQVKREEAARRAITDAQVLVAHDEQAKALILLEQAVPYFAQDHPDVVTIRSQLRERLAFLHDSCSYAEHYETGGSKPEDFMDDERALQVAGVLPRAQFLLAGLVEQIEAKAA